MKPEVRYIINKKTELDRTRYEAAAVVKPVWRDYEFSVYILKENSFMM